MPSRYRHYGKPTLEKSNESSVCELVSYNTKLAILAIACRTGTRLLYLLQGERIWVRTELGLLL